MKNFIEIFTMITMLLCGFAFIYCLCKGDDINAIEFMGLFIINQLSLIYNKE